MSRRCAKPRSFRESIAQVLVIALTLLVLPACAQTAPGPEGQSAGSATANPNFSAEEIATLVAPIALYPDDLLAVVLPASTYPLQIVEAQRFLEARANDQSLKPHDDWDDSVVALLNYPDVVKLMNSDLDWLQNLGSAVLQQQPEVIAAIEGFRKRAYTAGNLKTDDRQVVAVEGDTIKIRPADPKVIYVPYYEPTTVTVYHSVPAYYYYPMPYPVYYYPYPDDYLFASGYFWGVTTFYSLGWDTHHVHVYYDDYYDHPYYGSPYRYGYGRYYYRRPPPHHYYDHDDDYDHDHDYDHDYDHDQSPHDRPPHGQPSVDHPPQDQPPQDQSGGGGQAADGDHHRGEPGHARSPDDTYWRPNYRRAGARPGADPRGAWQGDHPQGQQPGSGTSQGGRPPAASPGEAPGSLGTPQSGEAPAQAETPPRGYPPGRPESGGVRPEQSSGRPDGAATTSRRHTDRYPESRPESRPDANSTPGAPDQPYGAPDREHNGHGQPGDGSLQQRIEAQDRGAPVPTPPVGREPQMQQPATRGPEMRQPEMRQPEMRAPESGQPEMRQPQMRQPEVRQPQPQVRDSQPSRPVYVEPSRDVPSQPPVQAPIRMQPRPDTAPQGYPGDRPDFGRHQEAPHGGGRNGDGSSRNGKDSDSDGRDAGAAAPDGQGDHGPM